MPKLDAPGHCAARGLGSGRPIDLGDEWSLVFSEEALDARKSRYEGPGKVRNRGRAYDDQQGDAMPHDRVAFVRLIANAAIVGYRDPAALAYLFKPR